MSTLFPPGAFPSAPAIQYGKALLLIDFQNDFVSPEGKLPVESTQGFLPRLPSLAKQFRSKGTIVWSRTEYTQTRQAYVPELGPYAIILKQFFAAEHGGTVADPSRVRRRRPSQQQQTTADPEAFLGSTSFPDTDRPCLPGSWGAQYPQNIADAIDHSKDIEIVKSHYSAFADSSLLLALRMRLITHVYICGSLSNISVFATVLDAVRHGIKVTLVEDLLGYIDEACHLQAVNQMVDNMGAGGIDYQELMDDLAGLLGDVIREEDFPTRFQVSMPTAPPGQNLRQIREQRDQRMQRREEDVDSWRSNVRPDSKAFESEIESDRRSQKTKRSSPSASDDSTRAHKSKRLSSRQNTPDLSPPRERSNSGLGESAEILAAKSARDTLGRPSPLHTQSAEGTRYRIPKPRTRPRRAYEDSPADLRSSVPLATAVTQSTSDLPDTAYSTMPQPVKPDIMSPAPESPPQHHLQPSPTRKPKASKSPAQILSPTDTIGQGDSRLHLNILSTPDNATTTFHTLLTGIPWQKMSHRTGTVPRLVAVQGQITPEGDKPIYRHPADESPVLLPFSQEVLNLKILAEKIVGHGLNHVLIQLYRSGEDSISEHSDKTLDIVRGSKIVNFSLGARRTMTLRRKRSDTENVEAGVETKRETRKIQLPHNSIFVLGEETNAYWLHSIKADKRPSIEKDEEELAFNGERISLTFRNIGTFVNEKEEIIWGMGATGKTKDQARKLLEGDEGAEVGEDMIIAFGRENHKSQGWDWEENYGMGFDVINFAVKREVAVDDDPGGGGGEGGGGGGGDDDDQDSVEGEGKNSGKDKEGVDAQAPPIAVVEQIIGEKLPQGAVDEKIRGYNDNIGDG